MNLLLLVVFWLICSGRFELHFLILGLFFVIITYLISRKMQLFQEVRINFKSIARLLFDMLKGSFIVSLKAWQIEPNLNPGLLTEPHQYARDLDIAFSANSITLAPGTICVHADKNAYYVHSLIKELKS